MAIILVLFVMLSTFVLNRFLGLFLDLGEGHEVFLQDYYYAGFGIERGRWVIDNPPGGFGSGYTEELYIDTTTFDVDIENSPLSSSLDSAPDIHGLISLSQRFTHAAVPL